MLRRDWRWCAVSAFLVAAVVSPLGQEPSLSIVRADPNGELSELADAEQIRIVFSEPMVPLGVVPDGVQPSWIRIVPALPGSFYWSGTKTLVFSPDAAVPVPYSTRFTVRVDGSARSVAGHTLSSSREFTFTTPTLRLLGSSWYRKGGRFDDRVVVGLRFNQPVRKEDVLAHARVAFQPHVWDEPVVSRRARDRWREADRVGYERFAEKASAVHRVAMSSEEVEVRLAESWDWRGMGLDRWLVVLETAGAPPPDAWLRVTMGERMPAAEGPEPHAELSTVLKLEHTLFAHHPMSLCDAECGPVETLGFTQPVAPRALLRALTIADETGGLAERLIAPERSAEEGYPLSLRGLGFPRQPVMSRWRMRIDASLQSRDGQTLGYSWAGMSDRGHETAAIALGGSVFEAGRGVRIPVFARNVSSFTQWLVPVLPQSLMPTLRKVRENQFGPFRTVAPNLPTHLPGEARSVKVVPDVMQRHALDLSRVMSSEPGLAWVTISRFEAIPSSVPLRWFESDSHVVQITNLGITAKHSPHSSLFFVTRLDTGDPVADANVAVVDGDNVTRWRGVTDVTGVARAPAMRLPDDQQYALRFVVTAEKDGDFAFVGSNWSRGGGPYGNFREREAVLRGSVFTDRGVYRQRDSVNVKVILRDDTPDGMRLLAAGTELNVVVQDDSSREVDRRTIRVSQWSSAEWTWQIPPGAALGYYDVAVSRAAEGQPNYNVPSIAGRFLVSAYRTPDFRVDATLAADPPIAGSTLRGTIQATYLFGGPVGARPVTWVTSRRRSQAVPAAVRDRFPAARYAVGYVPRTAEERSDPPSSVERGTFGGDGQVTFDVASSAGIDAAYEYTVASTVWTASGQYISARASALVYPSSIVLAMSLPPAFVPGDSIDVRLAAADLSGRPIADVTMDVALLRVLWTYPGDDESRPVLTEVPSGQWSLSTDFGEVPLHVPVPQAGSYILRATARDAAGRPTRTEGAFYSVGPGRPSWRGDRSRIELIPERATWKPGESARILVQSPWERATALLTVEREGVRSHRTFTIGSTQDIVEVPITEADVPNVFVSVVLVKGRTARDLAPDGTDPGRPAYRVGHVELKVDDDSKRLRVEVSTDRQEYRPGQPVSASVRVSDRSGRPAPGEVTFWAVDYGVLSLTGYTTPDVLDAIYRPKSLQVTTSDNRERLLTAPNLDGDLVRVADADALFNAHSGQVDVMNARMASVLPGFLPGLRRNDVRDDFRPIVFWLGSATTGADGRVSTTVRLPDSLTTYRVMAVVGDRVSRFGFGEREIRAARPLALLPAFPRFLSPGDRASFGAVASYAGPQGGEAVVTIESLDAGALRFAAPARRRVRLEPGVPQLVKFDAVAGEAGRARVRMTVTVGTERDAFELPLSIVAPMRPETTAAYGEVTAAGAAEALALPGKPLASMGGLTVELASTALVGLGESARYVTDYWHNSTEQRASRALVLLLASELDGAFRLSKIAPAEYRAAGEAELRGLAECECRLNGGFSVWPGPYCSGSPYLTAYVLHVMQVAKKMGVAVDEGMIERGLQHLEWSLRVSDGGWTWRGARAASRAYAVKVLAEYGKGEKVSLSSLFAGIDDHPVFALSYLADALHTRGDRGAEYQDLVRRISNALRVNADRAHVEESDDASLPWVWSSDTTSTAVVLQGLSRRQDAPDLVAPLVRWLMAERKDGRWGTTHENARALEALVEYYRAFEAEAPRVTAEVLVGKVGVGTASFRRRSQASEQVTVPMRDLLERAAAGTAPVLSIARAGPGRLYYTARVQAFVPEAPEAVDRGFRVERRYVRYAQAGGAPATTFSAGDLVRVTVTVTLRGEGRYLALTDPLPAGFEPVDGAFQTTERQLALEATRSNPDDPWSSWRSGAFDHVEKHDDRVVAFATMLGSGRHEFSYLVRATTTGSFSAAGARVEAMYAPELSGRSAAATVDVR